MAICPTCGGSGVVPDPVQPQPQPQPVQPVQPQPVAPPVVAPVKPEMPGVVLPEIIDAYKRLQQTSNTNPPVPGAVWDEGYKFSEVEGGEWVRRPGWIDPITQKPIVMPTEPSMLKPIQPNPYYTPEGGMISPVGTYQNDPTQAQQFSEYLGQYIVGNRNNIPPEFLKSIMEMERLKGKPLSSSDQIGINNGRLKLPQINQPLAGLPTPTVVLRPLPSPIMANPPIPVSQPVTTINGVNYPITDRFPVQQPLRPPVPAKQPFIPIGVNSTQPKLSSPVSQGITQTAPTNGYTQPKQQPTIDPIMAEQEKSRQLKLYAQNQSVSQLRNPLGTIYKRFGLR